MASALKEFIRPFYRRAVDALPPRWHVIVDFLRFHRYWPHIEAPRTFNEKIAWRKLYERNPMMPKMADKVQAKEIVAEKFGKNLIIPTLALYDSAAAMDFNHAPLSQPPYVLKTNHGSGFNIFVKQRPADPEAIRKTLATQLKTDYADIMEEWAYSAMPRKILVEPFVQSADGTMPDYKFHVFGGTVFAIELVIDRFKSYRINFFDRDWKPLDIHRYAKRPRYDGFVPPPVSLPGMILMAEALGKDFPYVRVDLYEIDRQIKFGEMTFYPGGGHDRFDPLIWDETFGRQWKQDWSARATVR